jgi:peptide/nickel transport system substrate-binding protein
MSRWSAAGRARGWEAIVAVCVAAVIAACNVGTPSTSPAGSGSVASPGETASTSPGTAGCATTGGTLIVATEDEPPTLVAADVRATLGTLKVSHPLQSMLVELDNEFNPVPGLADNWESTADGLTYTFHLNEAAKWHDGTPVTADDVIYSMNRNKELGLSGVSNNFASVEAPDPKTAVITLAKPNPGLLVDLGNDDNLIEILPNHLLKDVTDFENSDYPKAPVGSGPWVFKEWITGDHIELVRNEDYYRDGPCLDRLIMKFTPDPNARKVAFENGEIDVLYSYLIPLEELDGYRSNPDFQLIEGGLGTAPTDFLIFNTKSEVFAKKEVRQAIAYAIDRDAINQLAFFGAGKVAKSTMNSTLAQYFTDEFDVYSPANVAKAAELLDAAGLTAGANGDRFNLRMRIRPDRAFEARAADVIKSQLDAIGINVEIIPGDASTTYEAIYTNYDFDLAIQLRTLGPNPLSLFPLVFGEAGIGGVALNGGRYVNADLEALFDDLAGELDPQAQKTQWTDVQRITMDDMPWLPLVEFPNIQLASAKFDNVVTGALDYFGQFATTYERR